MHKQDTNAHATGDWFSKAKGIATPNVHRIVGETITMDYVEHDEGYFDDNFHMGLALIQNKLEAMIVLEPLIGSSKVSSSLASMPCSESHVDT